MLTLAWKRVGSMPVRRLVNLSGAFVALLTAFTFPIGYGVITYIKEADTLSFKAELTAARAARHVHSLEAPWRNAPDQLAAIGEVRAARGSPIAQRILDTRGKALLRTGPELTRPTLVRVAPIMAFGKQVGRAEVSASLAPLIGEVSLVAIGTLVLALAAYFAFALLPLKALDKTLGELEMANDRFRGQNTLLDAALENMPQGLAMFDANERVVVANDRYADLLGLAREDVLPGTPLTKIVERRMGLGHYPGQSVDEVIRRLRGRVALKQATHLTDRLHDGRLISCSIQPRPDGGWVTTHQDITEREQLNARLAQQHEQLDVALNNMVHGLAMFDSNLNVVIANDRFADMYGLRPDQVQPGTSLRTIAELRIANGLYVNLTADDVIETMRTRVARHKVSHITSRLGDGRTIAVSVHPRADGGWVTTHQDITEREKLMAQLAQQNELLKQREEELKAQNDRFRAAINNMSQGVCLFDAEKRVVIANNRYAELYGLSQDQVSPGTSLRDILNARAARGVYRHIDARSFVETGLATYGDEKQEILQLADGRFISVLRRPMPDGSLVSTHEDITEREQLHVRLAEQNALLKQREEELKAQNERLDAALANMSHGLCMFDAEQRVVVANARYAEIYGLTLEQVKPGTPLRAIVEHRIAKGLYAGENPDAYVKERLATFRDPSSKIHHLSDGRSICITRSPMEGGGWVTMHEDVTERENLKLQLEQQNEQLDAAMNNMSQGLAMFDGEQRLVVCNRHYAEMYGLKPEQIPPGTTVREILEHRVANGTYAVMDGKGFVDTLVGRFGQIPSDYHRLVDGRVIHVAYRPTANGGTVITHEDITAREQLNARLEQQNQLLKNHEERLRTQNVQLDAALNNMVQGLAMFDADLRLVLANARYAEIYGLTPDQVQPGMSLREIIEHRLARGLDGSKTADEMMQAMLERTAGKESSQYTTHLGDGRCIAVSIQPMADGGTVTTHQDITEQRRSDAKIAYMALHDALTGLPNRVLLNERIEQALVRVNRGEIVATHLLDLDHFKNVNDTLGHPAGDKLLKLVTGRLRTLVRETDTIARMGGDEFAIVQVGIAQPSDATSLAHRVIEVVSEPYEIDGQQVIIGTSVGIAVGPADGLTPDQLMRNADLALYRAKGDGRGTFCFFEPEMDAQMQARRAMEYDLRKALAAGEFELHYQPVVNLRTNEISSFEALIRWRHPERGMISPGTFIPLAEEIGFIVPLGEWTIREACATAAKWPHDIKISVNLSPVQFRNPGLVNVVVNALVVSGLAPERLELEITETALLEDSEATLTMLYRLRELGVRIAMDDFGTGYSSLSYLQSFPFDRIKIDRSFIKDIADAVGSLNIVRAVAALANGLGMATTAEGVETQEQLETVKSEGCTEMQGFLFSRPRPVSEIEQLFLEQKRAAAGGDEMTAA
ncbi:MAG TPA: PAS-domain containing protein [Hyphomicrobiaceae bacterium]|nr:PAS-domain containing protein [Hyphomicrobiaceae bacterium]